MRTVFLKLLRAGVVASAWMEKTFAFFERLLRVPTDAAGRRSGRFKALERRESEIERLDRIRNPGDYRGR